MITMRQATAGDSDMLFAWRNDPGTQAASRSTAPVPREDHERWMQFNVNYGYPSHLVMIAENDDGSPLGVVRFDSQKSDVMAFEVSITIAPKHRDQGLARPVLERACSHMSEYTILAEVKRDNLVSRRVFERCGFEETSRSSGYLQYRKEPAQ